LPERLEVPAEQIPQLALVVTYPHYGVETGKAQIPK